MISVIIPIYNQADKLSECLNSIFKQTYNDLEIILVNDGSNDHPEKVIEKFKGIKYYKQENKGAPAARNTGLSHSTGEYLFFCDADAILEPNCFNELTIALKRNPGASYAYSSFLWGNKLFKVGPFSAERLNSGPFIHTMSLIRKVDFPEKGWDESIKKFQDWDLYLTMLKKGKTGIWVDKILFKIQPGGTISSWLPSFAYKLFPFLPQVKKYKKALAIVKIKHKI